MEKETNRKDKNKDNTLASKCHCIHCGGPSRAAVDIIILQMELLDNMLDNRRSICVKQPYLDKISGIILTPSPSAWLNVVAQGVIIASKHWL
eukprot:15191155-Ditylum_brightwellii.AAC.1